MPIWRMRIACLIPKATNTHSEYVILIAFPLQQWLHERASTLRFTYPLPASHLQCRIPRLKVRSADICWYSTLKSAMLLSAPRPSHDNLHEAVTVHEVDEIFNPCRYDVCAINEVHFSTADNPQFVVMTTYPVIFGTRKISLKVIYIKTGAVIWPQRDRGQYNESRTAVSLPSGWSQLLQPQTVLTPTWTPLLTVPSVNIDRICHLH